MQAAEQDGIVFIDEIDKIVVGPEGDMVSTGLQSAAARTALRAKLMQCKVCGAAQSLLPAACIRAALLTTVLQPGLSTLSPCSVLAVAGSLTL